MSKTGQGLLDEINDYLQGNRYDRYVAAKCPFHDDSRPSFFVYVDYYYCSSCEAKGRTETLLKKLKERAGTFIPVYADDPFSNPFTKWLKQEPSLAKVLKRSWSMLKDKNGSKYLRSRNIPVQDQVRLGLGMRDNWVTFPIRNQKGQIIGAVARDISGKQKSKYVVPKGQDPNMIYVPDWKMLDLSRYIYCTFGIIDAVSIVLAGKGAFSTTSGHRLDHTALDNLRKRILFVPDYGEDKAAYMIASKLGWRGAVLDVHYPEGMKDCNDLWRNHPEQLRKSLNYIETGEFVNA